MKENLFPVTNAHRCSHADLQSIRAPKSSAAYSSKAQLNLDEVPTLAAPEVIILSLCGLLCPFTLRLNGHWYYILIPEGQVEAAAAAAENNSWCSCLWGHHQWAMHKLHHLGERLDCSKVLAQPIAMSVAATYSADGSCFFVFRGFLIISRLQCMNTFELALAKSQGF